jgi:predicted DNA-binding ribbon-helix-helix protein
LRNSPVKPSPLATKRGRYRTGEHLVDCGVVRLVSRVWLTKSPGKASYSAGSPLAIHNVLVGNRRTTVRLEPVMWDALHDIARRRQLAVNALLAEIEGGPTTYDLTAAIRIYIVEFYRAAMPPV